MSYQVTKYAAIAVALFWATAALFAGQNNSHFELFKQLPRHNTIAGIIDIRAIRQNPALSQLLSQENTPFSQLNDFDAAAVSFDSAGRRFSAICRFSSPTALKNYFKKYSQNLLYEKNFYRVVNSGSDLNGAKVIINSPETLLFYHDYPEQTHSFDRFGLDKETVALLHSDKETFACFGGKMKMKKEPFKSIRSFNIFLSRNHQKIQLHGMASCRKPMNASLTHMALLGLFSMYLQEYCDLSPENAGKIVSLLKVRQHGKNLYFQLDDVEKTIAQIIKLQAENY